MQQTQEKKHNKASKQASTVTDRVTKTEQLPLFLSANNNNSNINNIEQTDHTLQITAICHTIDSVSTFYYYYSNRYYRNVKHRYLLRSKQTVHIKHICSIWIWPTITSAHTKIFFCASFHAFTGSESYLARIIVWIMSFTDFFSAFDNHIKKLKVTD